MGPRGALPELQGTEWRAHCKHSGKGPAPRDSRQHQAPFSHGKRPFRRLLLPWQHDTHPRSHTTASLPAGSTQSKLSDLSRLVFLGWIRTAGLNCSILEQAGCSFITGLWSLCYRPAFL